MTGGGFFNFRPGNGGNQSQSGVGGLSSSGRINLPQENATRINSLDSRVMTLESTISSTQQTASQAATKLDISDLRNKINTNVSSISQVKTDTNNNKALINGITSSIKNIDIRASNAQNAANVNSNRITTVEGNVGKLSSQISTIENRSLTNQNNITSNQASLSGLTSKVTSNENRFKNVNSDITSIKSKQTTMSGDISNVSGRITSVETSLQGRDKVKAQAAATSISTRFTQTSNTQVTKVTNMLAQKNEIVNLLPTLRTTITDIQGSLSTLKFGFGDAEAVAKSTKTALSTIKSIIDKLLIYMNANQDSHTLSADNLRNSGGDITSLGSNL